MKRLKKERVIAGNAPKFAGRTAARLFGQLKNQRGRLIAVAVCIVIYTVLNIFTPYYSAIVVDALLGAINDAISGNAPFSIVWEPLGREMTILCAMYAALGIVYYLRRF